MRIVHYYDGKNVVRKECEHLWSKEKMTYIFEKHKDELLKNKIVRNA